MPQKKTRRSPRVCGFLRFHWGTKQKFCWLAALASFNCAFVDTAHYSSRIPLFCPMVSRIVNCTNLHHGIALIWQHKAEKISRLAPLAAGVARLLVGPRLWSGLLFFRILDPPLSIKAQGKLVSAPSWVAPLQAVNFRKKRLYTP